MHQWNKWWKLMRGLLMPFCLWWWRIPTLSSPNQLLRYCLTIYWCLYNNSAKLGFFFITLFLNVTLLALPEFLARPVRSVWTPVRPVSLVPVAFRSSCPPAELDHCSSISLETCSTTEEIWSIKLADDSSMFGFSMSIVKSEFLFNILSFWHDRLASSSYVYFST